MEAEVKFKLAIETGNAVFEDVEDWEVARLLRVVALNLEAGLRSGNIPDANGNNVGYFEWEE